MAQADSKVTEALALPIDQEHLCPVHYFYDYMANAAPFLITPPLKLNEHLRSLQSSQDTKTSEAHERPESRDNAHSISISPVAAGLHVATGLQNFQQTKHWKAGQDMIEKLLNLMATDESTRLKFKQGGSSLADLAQRELPRVRDTWARFFMYLWPYADKRRTELLAATLVYIFIGDDIWEMHSEDDLLQVKGDFNPRVIRDRDQLSKDGSKSDLQAFIDSTILGFGEEDAVAGNGGQEVLDRMRDFFCRPHPPKEFKDFGEFMNYRIADAAVPYVFASVKFSLSSNVDLASPALEKFIRLTSEHVSIANDLGSWKKEKRQYDAGKVVYLINTVDMVQRVMCLPDEEAAISQTYALQLLLECRIDVEIERLRDTDALSEEEWHFVHGVMIVLSGNVLVSHIMSRYGGEATRLEV